MHATHPRLKEILTEVDKFGEERKISFSQALNEYRRLHPAVAEEIEQLRQPGLKAQEQGAVLTQAVRKSGCSVYAVPWILTVLEMEIPAKFSRERLSADRRIERVRNTFPKLFAPSAEVIFGASEVLAEMERVGRKDEFERALKRNGGQLGQTATEKVVALARNRSSRERCDFTEALQFVRETEPTLYAEMEQERADRPIELFPV